MARSKPGFFWSWPGVGGPIVLVTCLALAGAWSPPPRVDMACAPTGATIDYWRLARLIDPCCAPVHVPTRWDAWGISDDIQGGFPFRTGVLEVLASRVTRAQGPVDAYVSYEVLASVEKRDWAESTWLIVHLGSDDAADWRPYQITHTATDLELSEEPTPETLAPFVNQSDWELESFCNQDLALSLKTALEAHNAQRPLPCNPKRQICPELRDQGERAFGMFGCGACHSTHPAEPGIPLAGLIGKVVVDADGSGTLIDREYIWKRIEEHKVPSFAGSFNDSRVSTLVQFIESLPR